MRAKHAPRSSAVELATLETPGHLQLAAGDAVEPVPPELLKRYFQRGIGVRAGTCRIKPELQERLRFQRINLFQTEYPLLQEQHVIFCRNAMIYFDLPPRATAVHRLTRHLSPGGYLVVGNSESLLGVRHDLQPVQQGIYQRS